MLKLLRNFAKMLVRIFAALRQSLFSMTFAVEGLKSIRRKNLVKYELGVVLHPHMEEEAIAAEHEQLLELVARFGGVLDKVDNWGRRKLAYEIDKLTEGHYCFFLFDAPATCPPELESRLRIREKLLRFFIIRKDELM